MRQWWKNPRPPHPGAVVAAAGILLFGARLYQAVRTGPVPRAAAVTPSPGPTLAQAPPLELPSPLAPSLALPSQTPGLQTTPAPQPPTLGPPAPTPLFPPPPAIRRKPAGFIGPEAPVRGPQWKGAALPPLGPELLNAMMDPRAARRAPRLRRLGITVPEDAAVGLTPDPAARLAARPEPALPGPPGAKTAPTAAVGQPPGSETKPSLPSRLAPARPSSLKGKVRPPAVLPAGPGPAPGAAATASAAPGAGAGTGPSSQSPGGAGTKNEARETAAVPPGSPTIHLQARLDRARPEYRVGEWVALRFFASQPAHLRVYRVDAAGRVTRLFSTYSHEDSSQPARSFSMMVKAGQPGPGQERVVAIGSARPLSRDELLDCLRSYLTEGPSENPAPGPEPAAQPSEDTPVPSPAPAPLLPLADALRAVIAAVGRGGDLPAGMAGLERSAWSVAVGRFVSRPKGLQQSAVSAQPVSGSTPVAR
jgi:hypothetical protein